jgi:hypothetical protein
MDVKMLVFAGAKVGRKYCKSITFIGKFYRYTLLVQVTYFEIWIEVQYLKYSKTSLRKIYAQHKSGGSPKVFEPNEIRGTRSSYLGLLDLFKVPCYER